jgi:putative sigma-54 modulation protein
MVDNGIEPGEVAVEVHSPELTLPADFSEYVQAKMRAKLAKFGHRVTELVIHIREVAGSRGGVDKVCHLEARLAGLEPVNLEERHEDLRAVVDITADRAAEVVHRHLERPRSRQMKEGRKLAQRAKTGI